MSSHIPDGYTSITPYLLNHDADGVVRFLQDVFDAVLVSRSETADGRLRHADLTIDGSHLMIGNATEEWPPIRASCYLYVSDTDEVYARAVKAGARTLMAPADQTYGERSGGFVDPGGNTWWIATPLKSV